MDLGPFPPLKPSLSEDQEFMQQLLPKSIRRRVCASGLMTGGRQFIPCSVVNGFEKTNVTCHSLYEDICRLHAKKGTGSNENGRRGPQVHDTQHEQERNTQAAFAHAAT